MIIQTSMVYMTVGTIKFYSYSVKNGKILYQGIPIENKCRNRKDEELSYRICDKYQESNVTRSQYKHIENLFRGGIPKKIESIKLKECLNVFCFKHENHQKLLDYIRYLKCQS